MITHGVQAVSHSPNREVMTYEQRSSHIINDLACNSFNNRRITAPGLEKRL